jgi:hypothetical protein
MKPGVNLNGLRSEMVVALLIADGVFGKHGVIVTSATDGKHGRGSLHYVGLAVDLRTRHLPQGVAAHLKGKLAEALGPQYDVVLEKTHLHVEYQPK